jgi:hypothetical protein
MSYQMQLEQMNQSTTMLQNISNYIDTLTGDQMRTPEHQELMNAIKDHLEVSWIVHAQICAIHVPVLSRAAVPQTEEGLIADGEWQGFNPYSLAMDIEDEYDEDNALFLTPPTLTRQMTRNHLDQDQNDEFMSLLTRQSSVYPLQPYRAQEQGNVNQNQNQNYNLPINTELDDSIPPMQPILMRQTSVRMPFQFHEAGQPVYSRTT